MNIGLPELVILCLILTFIVVVVLLVWLWFTRIGIPITSAVTRRETPLEVLKARYARGEITKEQFEQMKEDLKN
jgi:putative membrane protein